MKARPHLSGPLQGNGGRQLGIDSQHPRTRRAHGHGVEMNHLTGCVDPGVGPTGTDGDDRMAGDEADGILYGVLQGNRMGLRLPPGKIGAVILHDRGDPPRLPGARRH